MPSGNKINFCLYILASTTFFILVYLFLSGRASAPNRQSDQLDKTITSEEVTNLNSNDQIGVKSGDELTFAIAGDMMFGRSINYYFQGKKLPEVLGNLDKSIFLDKDLSLVNLEGPISKTAFVPDNTPNNLVFNFPPKTAEVLNNLGVNAVGLANNHTNNQGNIGVVSTIDLLTEQHILPIGSERDFNSSSVGLFQKGNIKVSVIAINCLEVNTDIVPVIKQQKDQGNLVVVFPHWGIEYERLHSAAQEKLAHRWIDNGAGMIIGSHPHVMQDAESYQGKPIFYSLGNLLFDQTFSSATQRGLVITGEITVDQIRLNLNPIVSKSLKPELLIETEKEQVIDKYFDEFRQIRDATNSLRFDLK